MQGIEKNREFMNNPGRWPQAGFICLKKYIGLKPDGSIDTMIFARLLVFPNNPEDKRYKFVPDSGDPIDGGRELVQTITLAGWMVD
jgi:hypothetical protein